MDINVIKRITRCITLDEMEARYLAALTKEPLLCLPEEEEEIVKQIREKLFTCATREIEGFASYDIRFLGEDSCNK